MKVAVVAGLSRLFNTDPGVAVRTGMNLAQAGELGFVLLAQAGTVRLIENFVLQPVLAAMVLSMFIAPFIIEYGERMVQRFYSSEWMYQAM